MAYRTVQGANPSTYNPATAYNSPAGRALTGGGGGGGSPAARAQAEREAMFGQLQTALQGSNLLRSTIEQNVGAPVVDEAQLYNQLAATVGGQEKMARRGLERSQAAQRGTLHGGRMLSAQREIAREAAEDRRGARTQAHVASAELNRRAQERALDQLAREQSRTDALRGAIAQAHGQTQFASSGGGAGGGGGGFGGGFGAGGGGSGPGSASQPLGAQFNAGAQQAARQMQGAAPPGQKGSAYDPGLGATAQFGMQAAPGFLEGAAKFQGLQQGIRSTLGFGGGGGGRQAPSPTRSTSRGAFGRLGAKTAGAARLASGGLRAMKTAKRMFGGKS